jgi:hypothetical protein
MAVSEQEYDYTCNLNDSHLVREQKEVPRCKVTVSNGPILVTPDSTIITAIRVVLGQYVQLLDETVCVKQPEFCRTVFC